MSRGRLVSSGRLVVVSVVDAGIGVVVGIGFVVFGVVAGSVCASVLTEV